MAVTGPWAELQRHGGQAAPYRQGSGGTTTPPRRRYRGGNTDPWGRGRRRRTMAFPLLAHLLSAFIVLPGVGDSTGDRSDREPDALEMLIDRPDHLPLFATAPPAADGTRWFSTGEGHRFGLVGEHRSIDRVDGATATSIGLVSERGGCLGSPDRLTIGATFVGEDPRTIVEAGQTAIFTAWGWRPNARTTIQPGASWSVDADGTSGPAAVSLGVRIEF